MDIRLEGAKNVRDFSQYGCPGCIRSAQLSGLTPADMELLTGKYRLRTVIDLRTTQEAEEKPDAAIPGVTYLHIPIFDEAVPGVSHENETDALRRVIPEMTLLYRLLVSEDQYVRQIRKVMAIINDPGREGAVLWHCTEGKDRCGIISALFLLSKGVPPKAVMKDYLRTNRVNRGKAWKYYFSILLGLRDPAFAVSVRDAYLARRKYLAPIMEPLQAMAASLGG